MTLFGKKDKGEETLDVNVPTAPKSNFQSAATSKPRSTTEERAEDMTTCFGKNLKITGNISGEGNLIVLGSFEGEFDLKGQLKVAQGATVKGNLKATSIAVNGNVEGTITASEKVHLDNTARITGRMVTPKISILDGAVFDGEMQMGKGPAQILKPAETSKPDDSGSSKPSTAPAATADAKKK
jgi:cytoskeletal protein CcmA (bactofilin family)